VHRHHGRRIESAEKITIRRGQILEKDENEPECNKPIHETK